MKFKNFYKKKIFESDKIEKLRSYFSNKNIFNKPIKMEELKNMNLLAQFIFSEKLISQLENFFNDQIYFMDSFVIQKNNRTFKKEKFHKDSGKKHQSRLLSKSSNIYGKIGIPLQNNVKGFGGGIDYLKPLPFDNFSDENRLKNKIRAIYYILQDFFTDTHFNSKIGDFYYFSAMLSHRTSFTKKELLNQIEDKYVIYYQILNLNTIKNTLRVSRKINEEIDRREIEKNVNIFKINNMNLKVLSENISLELGNFLGQ